MKKYEDLIQFDPITEVIEFSKTAERTYQQNLVKTYVFSKAIKETLLPLMVRNLDYSQTSNSFGLHVVGNYGTGKSHLMSLVSLIAEDNSLLDLVNDPLMKSELSKIAGQYKVLRFELGNEQDLWEIITYRIQTYLLGIGIEFKFDSEPRNYQEHLQIMMAEFEAKYPDKGLLVVIDEMLAYLKGRSEPSKLNKDLAVLQGMGQMANGSKFKIIFGVQEAIYQSAEFQFAAEMLSKVGDRYKDVIITKEDVAFIVKHRLLQKDEHQKQWIKNHLNQFLKYFKDMHARTQDYVDLFPVHPTYFENFEKIKIGKSQREVLKSLSGLFENLMEMEVPDDNPGFISYDNYWMEMVRNQDLLSIPDVRRVKEITDVALDKIGTHFTGARSSKKNVATRIIHAASIKILQADLTKQNGTTAENLVDDLCLTDPLATDREFLLDIIDSTSQQLISATSGQYFDKNQDNGEYHLRIEGGVNFDQKIKDYASTMSPTQKDEYFFRFLTVNLPLSNETYRTGFRIWEHSLEWKSHKTYRDGYIFFGNPNEKSTTHPRQHFYIYFMPIFDESKKKRNDESDEIYFILDGLSEEFRRAVTLYGAASALEASSDSSQKAIYRSKIDELNKKARVKFDEEYVATTQVLYEGKSTPLNGYPLPGQGYSKEQIFSEVASMVFEGWFDEENPDYPAFSKISTPITKDNFSRLLKSAFTKIIAPSQPNRDGEGILDGLKLYEPGKLDFSNSPYAKNILKLLEQKGEGQVLNRDEILECYFDKTQLWRSIDFKLEAELEFIALSVLAALGEIEIQLSSGSSINASNLEELRNLDGEDYFSFSHVKPPKGLNTVALKVMFIGFLGKDLSSQLKDQSTYTNLVTAASDWSKRTVKIDHDIKGGLDYRGIQLISDNDAAAYHRHFTAFSGFCDKLTKFNSQAKMKNFNFSVEQVEEFIVWKDEVEKVEKLVEQLKEFKDDIAYLEQCRQYIIDTELKSKITTKVGELGSILESDDDKKVKQYRAELGSLKNEYASFYLEQYLKFRISQSDDTKKQALIDSDEKHICDILKDADFLPSASYLNLLKQLAKLLPADPAVKLQSILNTPYHEFNPLEYQGENMNSVAEIKNKIHEILDQWINTLKETLDDPIVKKNLSLLDSDKRLLLEEFKSGKLVMDRHNAIKIRKTIVELHQGLEAIPLKMESLKETFNKPLTPDEAIEAFKKYVNKISSGKEREKIRIILK